jgi:mono/diheme cytochrome c family protein
MPLRRLFAATSVAFLAVLAISPAKNVLRPYRAIQRRYFALAASRAKSLKEARGFARRKVAIQQLWLRDFDDRVDRCSTCHLGTAEASMAGAPEPFRLHPKTAHTPGDFDRFGCTSCHGGQGLATEREDAHGTAAEAGPPMTPLPLAEAGCGRCHFAESVADAPMLSRGRALLEKEGCYACHTVRGHESFRSQAPPLSTESVKTGGAWLKRWLRNPRAVDGNATMPDFQLADKEIDALSNYLFSVAPPRELAPRISLAESEPAGDAAHGKKIFSEARCISCHTVEGKGNGSAPELSKVASAATRGWILAFLRDPQAFNPRTRMPRYHFSDGESRDVVAYIESEFRDFDAPADMLAPVHVNLTLAEAGQRIFRTAGCVSCHDPKTGERFGPDLNGIGDKKATSLDFGRRRELARTLPAWLAAKVDSPRSFAAGLKMPSFELGPEDTRAVVTALLSLAMEPPPEKYRVAAPSAVAPLPGGAVGRLFDRYRCLSCHRVGDRGEDVSTAPLTFEGSRVKRDWLVDYLVVPYSLRPILEERMPVFRMPREEAAQLADALETFFLDPQVPEDPFAGRPASDADAGEGQRLYVTLGCRACHILGSSGGYYGPPLTETPKRLKAGWIDSWLKGPKRWRSDARCPNYGLTDTDALRLTAYLESLPPAAPSKGTTP